MAKKKTEVELLTEEVKKLREDLRMVEMKKGWARSAEFNKRKEAFRKRMGRDPLPGEDLERKHYL